MDFFRLFLALSSDTTACEDLVVFFSPDFQSGTITGNIFHLLWLRSKKSMGEFSSPPVLLLLRVTLYFPKLLFPEFFPLLFRSNKFLSLMTGMLFQRSCPEILGVLSYVFQGVVPLRLPFLLRGSCRFFFQAELILPPFPSFPKEARQVPEFEFTASPCTHALH